MTDNEGLCGEKSELLVFLLKELGYGTVMFYFLNENHEAVGIKCPVEKSLEKSGYCFLETSGPSIITDNSIEYADGITISSEPEIMLISEGNSLPNNMYEYTDAKDLRDIKAKNFFGFFKFWKLDDIKKKYGLEEEYNLG